MTVTVNCPHCTKELHATDELLGKLVACPRCRQQFAIAADENTGSRGGTSAGGGAQSASVFDSPDPADSQSSPSQSGVKKSNSSVEHRALGGSGGSARFIAPEAADAPPVSAPPKTAHFKNVPPPPQSSAVKPAPTPPPAARPAPRATPPATDKVTPSLQHPSKRQAKSAKFVTDGAAMSRINLGADGQLPDLVVHEGKETKEIEDSSKSSNPLLLAVVLSISVGMSLLVLFVPSGGSGKRSADGQKQEARAVLQQHYIGKDGPVEPYQRILRQALQAYNQNDEKAEQRYYRQVLHMLRSESKSGSKGLTAPKFVHENMPPNDKDLEKQLSILLRED